MPVKNVIDVATVKIGDESYQLVRTEQYKQEWMEEGIDEPPWHEGLPPLMGIEEETWHLGGFKSREGIAGTSEYGDTDNRWPFRMIPGPFVTTVTLPDSVATPTSIFECLDYIFVVAGRYVYRIHKTTFAVVVSKDLDPYEGIMGLRWWESTADQAYVAAHEKIYKLTAIAGPPDTWTQGNPSMEFLARGVDRLFGANRQATLLNVSVGLDPTVTTNWADRIQCGPYVVPTGLLAYENTVLLGRPEGLYGVSADEGIGVPLIKRMVYDTENCKGMATVEPYAYIPHSRGLYRIVPGVSIDSVGLEREVLNRTLMAKAKFRAFAVDNQWVYSALEGPSGVHSYVTVSRDKRQGEPGLGPVIWDTFIDLGSAVSCRVAHVSTLTATPTLWFGKGNNVAYVKLSTSGGMPGADCSFAASNVRYSPRYHFGDWNDKDFPKVQMACKDVDATHYWSLAYKIDDTGSWITVDIDGNAMDVKTEGVKTFFFAVAAVGKEIQYRWTYTGPADGPSAFGYMVYFKRFARPQSLKVPVIKAILHLAAGLKHDMTEEGRDAVTQFNDLNTLSEQAASVPLIHRGDTTRVWVRHIQLLQTLQEGSAEPEFLVEATMQKREAA